MHLSWRRTKAFIYSNFLPAPHPPLIRQTQRVCQIFVARALRKHLSISGLLQKSHPEIILSHSFHLRKGLLQDIDDLVNLTFFDDQWRANHHHITIHPIDKTSTWIEDEAVPKS